MSFEREQRLWSAGSIDPDDELSDKISGRHAITVAEQRHAADPALMFRHLQTGVRRCGGNWRVTWLLFRIGRWFENRLFAKVPAMNEVVPRAGKQKLISRVILARENAAIMLQLSHETCRNRVGAVWFRDVFGFDFFRRHVRLHGPTCFLPVKFVS